MLSTYRNGFPRLYVAASLKPAPLPGCHGWDQQGFPRLYVAASLKLDPLNDRIDLIVRFPRLYVAASLKQRGGDDGRFGGVSVFRGFMSRPH